LDSSVQFDFRDRVEPVYRQFIDLLLHGDNPSQDNLKQARQAVEDLQLAELDNFFQDACAETEQVNIEDLDPHAAVIYPIILKDRLDVIVGVPGSPDLRYFSNSAVDQAKVYKTIRELRQKINISRTSIDDNLKFLKILYQWLILPIETELKAQESYEFSRVKTLVFTLGSELQNIPISSLYDSQRNRYLIERYAVAVIPGLQLLKSETDVLDKTNVRVLLAGTNQAPSFEREELKELGFVLQELEQIQSLVPENSILSQARFRQESLRSQINSLPFNVVHIASHGKFSSDPEETFVLDYNQRIRVSNLDLLFSQGQQAGSTPIELLTLSACQTARGDERAALGLAGVAIRAGARSTLASLWNVNDKSTASFMEYFYDFLLNQDMTKAEALRQVQLKFIREESDPNWGDFWQRPYHWAPFILVGNWL
jgi:CHAT domain-containing protein